MELYYEPMLQLKMHKYKYYIIIDVKTLNLTILKSYIIHN